ncbi:putative Na+/H+ antiporter [Candidatus Methylacidithermus pantelleriae]|nr:putative Na+/H+ antiporter [Candidatus Methylacidithermus pantelleriae]
MHAWATALFLLAVVHTFLTPAVHRLSRWIDERHQARLGSKLRKDPVAWPNPESITARLLEFAAEVEAVFGIWAIPLFWVMVYWEGWEATKRYWTYEVNYTEPLFVVVIMTIASSRPLLRLAEKSLELIARFANDSVWGWWFLILTFGPILGSFLTEPAAMTISSLLLAHKVYELQPKPALAYATLGLLFVNVSIGGMLTPFAAPPVLMVAHRWNLTLTDMMGKFGYKALLAIVVSNFCYALIFAREFARLECLRKERVLSAQHTHPKPVHPVPSWVTLVHLCLLGWTIVTSHEAPLFCGAFLLFLAFTEATRHYQAPLSLRRPLMVGFFLAGLALHGSLQGWWIRPLLEGLDRWTAMLTATFLTSFNDNALVTFLAAQVPNLPEDLKQAVLAGAVTGGGLTVIANAPNPIGLALLRRFFPDGVSPLGLLGAAAFPTVVAGACFMLL